MGQTIREFESHRFRHLSLYAFVFKGDSRDFQKQPIPQPILRPPVTRAAEPDLEMSRFQHSAGSTRLPAWCPLLASYPLTRARPRRISGQQALVPLQAGIHLAGSHNVTVCDANTSRPALARVRDAFGNSLPHTRGTLPANSCSEAALSPIASRARNAQGRRSHPVRLPRPQRAGFTDCHPHSREASCPRWQRATPQGHPRARGSQG